MGFKIEDLALGKMAKHNFNIDYQPMWKMLDEWERKTPGGFKNIEMKSIFERIYEYAIVSSGLDRADNLVRVENLNKQNLLWFTKADTLEAENSRLKERILELEKTIPKRIQCVEEHEDPLSEPQE